jgi:hypothetical protein
MFFIIKFENQSILWAILAFDNATSAQQSF